MDEIEAFDKFHSNIRIPKLCSMRAGRVILSELLPPQRTKQIRIISIKVSNVEHTEWNSCDTSGKKIFLLNVRRHLIYDVHLMPDCTRGERSRMRSI